ncbi:hypothetical protein R3P38DRAFT_3046916 [Favolaschia claudopus]|uniref:Uncharacterized protein n=1 Tax=Favolaschia claudopus TaxID=2862362 RepID=A0AAW0A733_9AGAR
MAACSQLDAVASESESPQRKRRGRTRSPSAAAEIGQPKRHCGPNSPKNGSSASATVASALRRGVEPRGLKPHPCTTPELLTEREDISRFTCVFLVDEIPPNYPYLPFHNGKLETLVKLRTKHQIPFQCFCGPDPPEDVFGAALGDLYVAPSTSTLYAYLASEDELFEEGAWKPWKATTNTGDLGGFLPHPHFPERYLWTINGFSWNTLDNLRQNMLKQLHPDAPEVIDVDAYTKLLVGKTLIEAKKMNEEYQRLLDKCAPKKKPKQTLSGKIAVLEEANRALGVAAQAHSTEMAALVQSLAGQVDTVACLKDANGALTASLGQSSESIVQSNAEKVALSTEVCRLRAEIEELRDGQAKLTTLLDEERVAAIDTEAERVSISATLADISQENISLKDQLNERGETIARLDAEKLAMSTAVEGMTAELANAKTLLDTRGATLRRVENEKFILSMTVEELVEDNKAVREALERERDSLPEDLIQHSSPRFDIKMAANDHINNAILQLQENFARERLDWAAELRAAETSIQGLRSTAKVLLAEIDRNTSGAQACISSQQERITFLEKKLAQH